MPNRFSRPAIGRKLRLLLRTASRAVACMLLCSCPAIPVNHTARTLEAGETEWAFGAGVQTVGLDSKPLPSMSLMARHGFGEWVDAGIQLTEALSLQADININLIEKESFALSINPSLGHHFIFGDVSATYFWLPVLADVYTTDTLTLTVVGRWGQARLSGIDDDFFDIEQSTDFVSVGVGARWEVSPNWTLLPELHVMKPTADELEDLTIYSFSLGVVF